MVFVAFVTSVYQLFQQCKSPPPLILWLFWYFADLYCLCRMCNISDTFVTLLKLVFCSWPLCAACWSCVSLLVFLVWHWVFFLLTFVTSVAFCGTSLPISALFTSVLFCYLMHLPVLHYFSFSRFSVQISFCSQKCSSQKCCLSVFFLHQRENPVNYVGISLTLLFTSQVQ